MAVRSMVGRLAMVFNAARSGWHAGVSIFGARGVVWVFLLGAFAFGLGFVPLLDLLGYDFSFAIGIATAFAAADVGHGVVATARRQAVERLPLDRLIGRAVAGGLALLVLPLLLSCLNALRVRNCNFASGFAFFALLPAATAVIAAPAGVLAGLLFVRRGRLFAYLVPALSILWTLWRLYVDPPVHAFDPFGGFFPGPIYDEALSPSLRLLWFRLSNLIVLAAVLALVHLATTGARPEGTQGPLLPRFSWRGWVRACRPPHARPRVLATTLLLITAALALQWSRGTLGFHRTAADVRKRLARTTRTPHFVIHSDPRDGQSREDLELFHRDLEFRHAQLVKILDVTPGGPITVYRFADSGSKKDLVGAATTLFAKPWRREIFIQVTGFPNHKLRHEIAHVFAAEFGDPMFGVALRWQFPLPVLASGLVEGVAEAADYSDPGGRATVHQDARAIVEQGRAPALERLVGAGFSTQSGPVAYTLAASFCHFLLTTHGAEKLRAIYRSAGDFPAVYGRPLAALESEWRAFLRQQPTDERQAAVAAERYRRPAIFKNVCARDLATRVDRAGDLRDHDPQRSIAILQSVCADDPGEPNYRIALAYSRLAAGQDDAARADLAGLIDNNNLTRPVRYRATQLAATLAFHRGDDASTRTHVLRSRVLGTSDADLRATLAQERALADPHARASLGRVLFGATPLRPLDPGLVVYLLGDFARRFPTEPLSDYLVGRQLAQRDARLAQVHLARACPFITEEPRAPGIGAAPAVLAPAFFRECLRLRGDAAFRSGQLPEARAAANELGPLLPTEAERLQNQDFLDRIAWAAATTAPPSL